MAGPNQMVQQHISVSITPKPSDPRRCLLTVRCPGTICTTTAVAATDLTRIACVGTAPVAGAITDAVVLTIVVTYFALIHCGVTVGNTGAVVTGSMVTTAHPTVVMRLPRPQVRFFQFLNCEKADI